MTREEAIAFGKRVVDLGLNDETHAFCELAIQALEQKPMIVPIATIKFDKDKLKELVNKAVLTITQQDPCEDAISRQAVLNATVKKNSIWNHITNSEGDNFEAIVSKLPSVTPQEPKMESEE